MGKLAKRLNQIYNKLSQGDEKDFLYYCVFLPLYFLSMLYGIGVKTRFYLYGIGVFKTRRLDCNVISIGNITVGGSGKTPMAIYLAEKFREKGKKTVILSRGYKGKIKDISVVSDGEGILLTPEDAGDEPYLMAVRLKNIPVLVGRDRYTAGLYAIEKFNPDVIILDDGFQHIRLHRDIDILLIDGTRGFGNDYLFPLGMLREPVSALKRASIILVKGSGVRGQGSERKNNLKLFKQIRDYQVIFFNYEPKTIINLIDNSRLPVDVLKNKKIAALSGIADPKSFQATLEKLGASVVQKIQYPDHYKYNLDDIGDIAETAKGADMIITTVKDAVKLKGFSIKHLPIYALEIEVEVENLDILEKVAGLR